MTQIRVLHSAKMRVVRVFVFPLILLSTLVFSPGAFAGVPPGAATGTRPELPTVKTPYVPAPVPPAPVDPWGAGFRFNLVPDGQSYVRVLTWAQIWGRYTEQNPGTLIEGDEEDHTVDIGIRRARLLLFGQITPRVQLMFHAGINNQTFNNGKKPQLYLHDVWVQYQVYEQYLSIGGGLHYWNGVSRMTNASTLTLMSMDAPILNWPTIEKTDQFARMLGVWAKGKLGPIDYRFAVNMPFKAGTGTETPKAAADYNPEAFAAAVTGYFAWEFLDKESNLLPYTTGTYLGTKKVFNVGAGFLWHPKAMWSLDGDGGTDYHDMVLAGLDAFVDHPIGPGAITAYGVYYYYDFGPDNLRNIGIMNYGTGGTSLNGAGNAYPVLGTGSHLYFQLGYLFEEAKLQPYVTMQTSLFEALDDPSLVYEVGLNWFLVGHHAKLTLNYRNRPVFEAVGDKREESARRSELILQGMIWI